MAYTNDSEPSAGSWTNDSEPSDLAYNDAQVSYNQSDIQYNETAEGTGWLNDTKP